MRCISITPREATMCDSTPAGVRRNTSSSSYLNHCSNQAAPVGVGGATRGLGPIPGGISPWEQHVARESRLVEGHTTQRLDASPQRPRPGLPRTHPRTRPLKGKEQSLHR
jgi:hypothetical protein